MPFCEHARIQLVNRTGFDIKRLYYDVDMTLEDVENPLYFQTVYKEVSNELLHDITIFDKSVGKGRFLGMNVTAIFNPDYEKYWFGESEVKVYFDGDSDYPTLAGTGVEAVSYTHLDVYKRQETGAPISDFPGLRKYRFRKVF